MYVKKSVNITPVHEAYLAKERLNLSGLVRDWLDASMAREGKLPAKEVTTPTIESKEGNE